MAISSKEEVGVRLIVEINNGEYLHLQDVLKTWGFKDYPSLLSFMLSLMALNEKKSFVMRLDNDYQEVGPAPDLLITTKQQLNNKELDSDQFEKS